MRVAIVGTGAAAFGTYLGLKRHAPNIDITFFDCAAPGPEPSFAHRDPRSWTRQEFRTLHDRMRADGGSSLIPGRSHFGEPVPRFQRRGWRKLWQSAALGGLTRYWSGSVFPFQEDDFDGWPIDRAELAPYYKQISGEISIAGACDQLCDVFGHDVHNGAPVAVSPILQDLSSKFTQGSTSGVVIGANRLAIDTAPTSEHSCTGCGECFYGCYRQSIFNAHFALSKRVGSIEERTILENVKSVEGRPGKLRVTTVEQDYDGFDRVYLAAGCVGSAEIVLRSLGLFQKTTELLDNLIFVFPIIKLSRLRGKSASAEVSIANTVLGLLPRSPDERYVHINLAPVPDVLFRNLLPSMVWGHTSGLASIAKNTVAIGKMYLHSDYGGAGQIQLDKNGALEIGCAQKRRLGAPVRKVLSRVRRAMADVGYWVPRNMFIQMRTSSHYAGTLPYGNELVPVHKNGELFAGVHVCDSPCSPGVLPHRRRLRSWRTRHVSPPRPSMASQRVLVTGARSLPGQLVIEDLCDAGEFEVFGLLHSPAPSPGRLDQRCRYVTSDLCADPDRQLSELLLSVSRVIHLAWDRSLDYETSKENNFKMVSTLLEGLPQSSRIILVSTIAASRATQSVYGRVKYEVEERILKAGGTVLVAGLLTLHQAGTPYSQVVRAVQKIPVKIRFSSQDYRFYPVSVAQFVKGIRLAAAGGLASDTYALFEPKGLSSAEFLGPIEAQSKTLRLPLPLRVGAVLSMAKLTKKLSLLPRRPAEKLFTFFTRDMDRLHKLRVLP